VQEGGGGDGKDLGLAFPQVARDGPGEIGETTFNSRYQAPVRSLAAFEQSIYADDWRDLMRLYLVRRTRSFIQDNYAQTDQASGRTYLVFSDVSRAPSNSWWTSRRKLIPTPRCIQRASYRS